MIQDTRVILHNIRSTHNVGSIFRTADAAGVSHIYISGYTPTPIDKFGRKQKDIAKTALGAEDSVHWEYIENPITDASPPNDTVSTPPDEKPTVPPPS